MELTKEEWIQIRRESKWYNDLRVSIFAKFLGIKHKEILCTYKKYDGGFFKNIIVVRFEEFLQKQGYKIVDHFSLDGNDYEALRKEDIEIAPGVYKRCVTLGLLLIEGKDHKFILEFQEAYHPGQWNVSIYYCNNDEEKTLKFLTDLEKYALDNNYLKNAKIDPELEHIKFTKKYTWNDLILPDSVRDELITNVDNLFKNIDIYKKAGLTFKRGIILQGVPGTGKTLIGKILAQNCNSSFIWVTSKFLGRADHIATVCKLARALAPTILFLEDIDLYGAHRSVSNDKGILGELMNQLDGLVENEFIVVIATTNEVKTVEDALKNRPGRFDRIIEVPKPDYDCRVKLLELFTKPHITTDVNLKSIAKLTEDFTPAHVKELVTTAVITAIDSKTINEDGKIILTTDYFMNNIQKVKNKKIEPVGFGYNKPLDDDCVPLEDDMDWDD